MATLIVCPRCKRPAANHSLPHCRKRLCGWLVCKKCSLTYEIPPKR